jgi:release factor glutamine methyltransferase
VKHIPPPKHFKKSHTVDNAIIIPPTKSNLITNTHSIKTTLLLAATQLKVQGIETETAKLEAQLLLQRALNVNRAWLIAHQHDAIEIECRQANIHAACRALIPHRLVDKPNITILV